MIRTVLAKISFENIKETLIDEGVILIIFMFISYYTPKSSIYQNISIAIMIMLLIILPFVSKRVFVMLFASIINLLLLIVSVSFERESANELTYVIYSLFISFFTIITILHSLIISYRIYNVKIEKPLYKKGCSKARKIIQKIFYEVDKAINKVSLMLPCVYYVILTFIIIFVYANLYGSINAYYENRNITGGIYTSIESIKYEGDLEDYIYSNYHETKVVSKENNEFLELNNNQGVYQNELQRIPLLNNYFDSKKITNDRNQSSNLVRQLKESFLSTLMSEYMYFSSVTFYTVGYGDIEIKGGVAKFVVQCEMFVSSMFNIIFIPFILFIITNYIVKPKESKARHINKKEIFVDKKIEQIFE